MCDIAYKEIKEIEMTNEQIIQARKLYDIPSDFYPVVTVNGVCTAWAKVSPF